MFLLYGFFYASFVLLSSVAVWIACGPSSLYTLPLDLGLNCLYIWAVSLLFTVSLGTLLGLHVYLIYHGMTTLESQIGFGYVRSGFTFDRASENIYKTTPADHFFQIFGRNPLLWCLPIHTAAGDGLVFEARSPLDD